MPSKMLVVNAERCTGCRLCEVVCSVKHTGVSNPTRARIRIVKWEREGFYLPIKCQHCEDAPCLAICPRGALFRDPELNTVRINRDLCIGCKMCVMACPFGAMGFDAEARKVFKCDLCHGDPQCVRFCYVKAVDYVEATKISYPKLREAALRYKAAARGEGKPR